MSTALAEARIVLGPEHNGMSMTPEEFDAVEEYDDEYVYELIRGVLIVNPFPSELERGPNEELGHWLRTYRELHPQGSALDLTLYEQYVRTHVSRRRADRLIWTGLGRMPDWVTELPTIAVEFVSARSRDRRRDYVEKRQEYLALGIKEYWIIDRFRRQMTVFRKQGRKIQETVLGANDTYCTPLLPGFELPLARLFEEAERMEQAQRARPKSHGPRRRQR
jgi:Uma2 family endonuclease